MYSHSEPDKLLIAQCYLYKSNFFIPKQIIMVFKWIRNPTIISKQTRKKSIENKDEEISSGNLAYYLCKNCEE